MTIKGQRVPYTVRAGTYPALDPSGRPIASIFHVFYKRTDVTDSATRPLLISFNGGPGSASVWLSAGKVQDAAGNSNIQSDPLVFNVMMGIPDRWT